MRAEENPPVRLSTAEAAELLSISPATLRNWVRLGYLFPEKSAGRFLKSDVLSIRKKIEAGEWDRLQRRANKKGLQAASIAGEYAGDARLIAEAEKIGRLVAQHRLDLERTLLAVTLKFLQLRGEVSRSGGSFRFDPRDFSGWRHPAISREMGDWMASLEPEREPDTDREAYWAVFESFHSGACLDPVGFIYQSLLQAGKKSSSGIYYTPPVLLENIFDGLAPSGASFLDPCCGTGQFLLAAAASGRVAPSLIYGVDRDPIAVKIARINLLLAAGERARPANIVCADVLEAPVENKLPAASPLFEGGFDMIATNPPWGAEIGNLAARRIQTDYPWLGSGESFSFFLARSLDMVKKEGRLSFVLPEAFLNIRSHAGIRRHLLENTEIAGIVFFGRLFTKVFSPVIRLVIQKRRPSGDAMVSIVRRDGRLDKISQKRFLDGGASVINAETNAKEDDIIRHVYNRPHVTLADSAQWALGIVTGDNRRYLASAPDAGREPVYRGRDVQKYRLATPDTFIRFLPGQFQQTAPVDKYRAEEKLIYRFVSRKLVFAFDDRGSLTLNSANILIPDIENYPIKAVLGVLNSRISQFLFTKIFNTHKVLRSDLEALPLPLLSPRATEQLVNLVDRAIAGEAKSEQIDALIMDQLGLSRRQIRMIRQTAD